MLPSASVIVRVTTLGSAKGDAVGAADAVVKYLDGRDRAPGGTHPSPLPELPTVDPTSDVVGCEIAVTGYQGWPLMPASPVGDASPL